MKKKLLLVFSILTINVMLGSLFSQNSDDALLKKLVEKNILSQEEANELSKETTTDKTNFVDNTTKKVRNIFSNIPYINIGGYGLMMYQYKEYDKTHHDFKARVIYLSVKGDITKNLSYFILTEFVDPMVYEYYIDWHPTKEFGIRGGQFKVPFTLENPISLTNLETVLNTRSVSTFAGMGDDIQRKTNGVNKTGRDLGIQISGSLINGEDHDYLQYSMGMFQGQGMNASEKNNNKDFAGSIAIQPVKGLRFVGGLYLGEVTYLQKHAYYDPYWGYYEYEKDYTRVRNRWALSADYKNNRFYARTEWIHANDGGIDKEGLYGTASVYCIPNKMNIVGKVDYLNNNKDYNLEVIDYTLGVNYYFYNQCRFQLNYTYSGYSKKWVNNSFGSNRRGENSVLAQMQIVF